MTLAPIPKPSYPEALTILRSDPLAQPLRKRLMNIEDQMILSFGRKEPFTDWMREPRWGRCQGKSYEQLIHERSFDLVLLAIYDSNHAA